MGRGWIVTLCLAALVFVQPSSAECSGSGTGPYTCTLVNGTAAVIAVDFQGPCSIGYEVTTVNASKWDVLPLLGEDTSGFEGSAWTNFTWDAYFTGSAFNLRSFSVPESVSGDLIADLDLSFVGVLNKGEGPGTLMLEGLDCVSDDPSVDNDDNEDLAYTPGGLGTYGLAVFVVAGIVLGVEGFWLKKTYLGGGKDGASPTLEYSGVKYGREFVRVVTVVYLVAVIVVVLGISAASGTDFEESSYTQLVRPRLATIQLLLVLDLAVLYGLRATITDGIRPGLPAVAQLVALGTHFGLTAAVVLAYESVGELAGDENLYGNDPAFETFTAVVASTQWIGYAGLGSVVVILFILLARGSGDSVVAYQLGLTDAGAPELGTITRRLSGVTGPRRLSNASANSGRSGSKSDAARRRASSALTLFFGSSSIGWPKSWVVDGKAGKEKVGSASISFPDAWLIP